MEFSANWRFRLTACFELALVSPTSPGGKRKKENYFEVQLLLGTTATTYSLRCCCARALEQSLCCLEQFLPCTE